MSLFFASRISAALQELTSSGSDFLGEMLNEMSTNTAASGYDEDERLLYHHLTDHAPPAADAMSADPNSLFGVDHQFHFYKNMQQPPAPPMTAVEERQSQLRREAAQKVEAKGAAMNVAANYLNLKKGKIKMHHFNHSEHFIPVWLGSRKIVQSSRGL